MPASPWIYNDHSRYLAEVLSTVSVFPQLYRVRTLAMLGFVTAILLVLTLAILSAYLAYAESANMNVSRFTYLVGRIPRGISISPRFLAGIGVYFGWTACDASFAFHAHFAGRTSG